MYASLFVMRNIDGCFSGYVYGFSWWFVPACETLFAMNIAFGPGVSAWASPLVCDGLFATVVAFDIPPPVFGCVEQGFIHRISFVLAFWACQMLQWVGMAMSCMHMFGC